jgi:hypothetical protein
MAKALYAKQGQPYLCAQGGYLIAGTDAAEPGCVCGGASLCCPQPWDLKPIESTRIAIHSGTFSTRVFRSGFPDFTQTDYTFDFDVALPVGSSVQSPCSYQQEYRTPYLLIGNTHTTNNFGLNTNEPLFLGPEFAGGPNNRTDISVTGTPFARITFNILRSLGSDMRFETDNGTTIIGGLTFGSVAISGTTITLTIVGSDSDTDFSGITKTRTYNFTAVYSGLQQCGTPSPPPQTVNIGGIEYPPGWVLNSDGVPIPPSHNCTGCGS